ncbi:MAG TPA: hypothetical protein VL635_01925 [Trinickia sp.]|nr:hypothetical protein [Trinickia sp.]
MKAKRTTLATVLSSFAVAFAPTQAADHLPLPKFEDHAAVAYTGPLHIPSYYTRDSEGIWRDDMGKAVAPVAINFAGKYYIGLHSCGTECRYFTLSDLSNGRDSKALDMFSSGDGEPAKTRDGRRYLTDVIAHRDSVMIVARYYIDRSAGRPPECRQRVFVLSGDGDKVIPITGTTEGCP